jgi:hypothetical protein
MHVVRSVHTYCTALSTPFDIAYTIHWGNAQVGVHFKGNKSIRYVQVGKGYWVLEYNEAGLVYFISCLESQYPKDRAI